MRGKVLSVLVSLAWASIAWAQSTAFTYQGRLTDAGQPANGLHDFRFKLFDAASGGTQVGTTLCMDNIFVSSGVFAATLDFGNQFSTPAPRFIEIEVRRDTGLNCSNVGGFVLLASRQAITPTPVATHAKSAFALDAANGSIANAVFVDNNGKVGIGTTTPSNPLSVSGNANFTGNVGIGTANPGVPLHIVSSSLVPAIAVASPFAAMNLQDTGPNATQTGYISYRNASGTETAWVGFGSPGDPDFSMVNARSSGDIVLNPLSGNVILSGANVGIGTSAPAAKLDVRGTIRFGPAGQYFPASGTESLRIVRGYVRADGTIANGDGFTVTHLGDGTYRINFTTPFLGAPVLFRQSQSGHLYDGGRVYNIGGTSCDVQNGVDSCGICDADFTFIAIGTR